MSGASGDGEDSVDPSEREDLKPGTRLGRYELLVAIASGGMARVWAARQHGQRGFHKLVAIKTILPHLAGDPEFERMFLDEARIASGLHHPNVCEIYELGEENRTLYLAMEWANGDSFSRLLRVSGKADVIDARIAARIVADACAGVHAAHELTDDDGRPLSVVHRDLSPHNVLVTLDGVTKVCDFGVAKALGQLHETTTAGQLKGKLGFMSPEQLTGGVLDRRSDVFSLGCVLYEATTGVRPFQGDGEHEVMTAVVKGEFPQPSAILRNYPPELERIVVRALAHDPIHRFPTTELMRYALEEFLVKGQLVTPTHVAQLVRVRVGDHLDRRRDAIRQASSASEARGKEREPQQVPVQVTVTPPLKVPPPPRQATLQMAAVRPPAPSSPTSPTRLPEIEGTVLLNTAGLGLRQLPPPLDSDRTIQHGSAMSGPPQPQPPSPPPPSSSHPAPSSHASRPPMSSAPSYSQPGRIPVPITSPDAAYAAPSAYPPSTSPRAASRAGHRPPASGGGAAQYAMAAGLGLFAALVIGAVGLFVWLAQGDSPRRHVTAVAPASSASTSTMPSASGDIVVQVTPGDATLIVDGLELGADRRSLARPPVGQMVTVVARAKGHDDATLMVDYFTVTPLEIVLKPAGDASAATGDSTPAGAASPAASARARLRPRPAELPDNPY